MTSGRLRFLLVPLAMALGGIAFAAGTHRKQATPARPHLAGRLRFNGP